MAKHNFKEVVLTKKDSSYNSGGRTYFRGDDKKTYFSQKENPRYTDPEVLRKGDKVYYNANNSIGEPEFALRKDKYKVTLK